MDVKVVEVYEFLCSNIHLIQKTLKMSKNKQDNDNLGDIGKLSRI